MQKKRFSSLNDYLALFVRRRWMIAISFIALVALTTLLATMVPKIYRSETMLQVQQREVPTEFVKDIIAGSTDQRLTTIEQIILSRTNLLSILGQFNNEMAGYEKLNDDERVIRLRKQIQIEFISERIGGQIMPTANVRIAYRDRNPELAQVIASRLAFLFIEQESKAREIQVSGTTQFLSSELDKVTEQLQKSEDRLKNLQEKFRYELPSELQTNLRTLDRLQSEKNSNLEALDRYMTMQLNLERLISDTPATLAHETASDLVVTGNTPENPLIASYRKKLQDYKELLAKYPEKYPSVQRLKEELEKLKKDISPKDLAAIDRPAVAANNTPNPAYAKLEGQLREVKTEIEIREREKRSIEAEMAKYNQRVQATPGIEQEMASIVRTNSDLTKQHDALKEKLAQAKLAESLENRQKGGQFIVVDSANLPLEPATPSRKKFWLVGCFISLAISLASAFIVGLMDHRIWTHEELERFLQAKVLVEIPRISTKSDLQKARKAKLAHSAVFIVCAGIYLGGLYYLHYSQSPILRIFNPVIEKLMERTIAS
jgi:polysaccharide chain length determinant protein (PEP-CTERM system associated)